MVKWTRLLHPYEERFQGRNMNTLKLLVALSLFTSPESSAEHESVSEVHAFLAPTLQQLAIKLEFMDQRETSYLFHEPNNFPTDLMQLQRRFQELVDAPAVSDADRFPDREIIAELLSANRAYRDELSQRLLIDPLHAGLIQQAIAETDHLHQLWTALKDARCGIYYVAVRRNALKQFRDLIGAPAYYRGDLPPHVPHWRIPRGR